MRRFAIVIILLLLAAGGVLIWQIITPEDKRIGALRNIVGSTQVQLESWIGQQLKAIANDYLKPELQFAQMRYEAPGTVHLRDVKLTSGDDSMLALSKLTVTLAEVPKVGKPIVIETLTLDAPTLRFMEREGTLVGWGDLVESTEGETKPDGGSTRLSDVFAIAQIIINDASIAYEQTDKPRMLLDGISLTLASDAQRDEAGWHRISTELERNHLLAMAIDGRINLDTFTLDLKSINLEAGINEDTRRFFPPNLQTLLVEHDVRGDLALELAGQLMLTDMAGSTLQAQASLTNAFARTEGYLFPINTLEIDAEMSSGTLDINRCELNAFDGTLTGDAVVGLTQGAEFEVQMSASGLRLEQFLAAREGTNKRPAHAGRVDAHATIGGQTFTPVVSLVGSGELTATEGRFGNLPVISDLIRAVAGLAPGGSNGDRLSTAFTIRNQKLRLHDIDLRSTAVAARGEGEIGFDQTLNLRLNAGPLEAIQNKLGDFGKILGVITDQLVTYQVRGTLKSPTVEVKPLGVGVAN